MLYINQAFLIRGIDAVENVFNVLISLKLHADPPTYFVRGIISEPPLVLCVYERYHHIPK